MPSIVNKYATSVEVAQDKVYSNGDPPSPAKSLSDKE